MLYAVRASLPLSYSLSITFNVPLSTPLCVTRILEFAPADTFTDILAAPNLAFEEMSKVLDEPTLMATGSNKLRPP